MYFALNFNDHFRRIKLGFKNFGFNFEFRQIISVNSVIIRKEKEFATSPKLNSCSVKNISTYVTLKQ